MTRRCVGPGWRRRGLAMVMFMLAVGVSRMVLGGTALLAGGTEGAAQVALVGPMPRQSTVEVGQTTVVSIYVQDIVDLYAADVQLAFEPQFVEVVDADPASPGVDIRLLPDLLKPDWAIQKTADNQAGTVSYAVTQMNPTKPVTGTGALAAIEFRGLIAGTTPITVTYNKLVRRDGTKIETTAENGSITVLIGGNTATPGPVPTRRPTDFTTPTATATDWSDPSTATSTPATPATVVATTIATSTPTASRTPTVGPTPTTGESTTIWLPLVMNH